MTVFYVSLAVLLVCALAWLEILSARLPDLPIPRTAAPPSIVTAGRV